MDLAGNRRTHAVQRRFIASCQPACAEEAEAAAGISTFINERLVRIRKGFCGETLEGNQIGYLSAWLSSSQAMLRSRLPSTFRNIGKAPHADQTRKNQINYWACRFDADPACDCHSFRALNSAGSFPPFYRKVTPRSLGGEGGIGIASTQRPETLFWPHSIKFAKVFFDPAHTPAHKTEGGRSTCR